MIKLAAAFLVLGASAGALAQNPLSEPNDSCGLQIRALAKQADTYTSSSESSEAILWALDVRKTKAEPMFNCLGARKPDELQLELNNDYYHTLLVADEILIHFYAKLLRERTSQQGKLSGQCRELILSTYKEATGYAGSMDSPDALKWAQGVREQALAGCFEGAKWTGYGEADQLWSAALLTMLIDTSIRFRAYVHLVEHEAQASAQSTAPASTPQTYIRSARHPFLAGLANGFLTAASRATAERNAQALQYCQMPSLFGGATETGQDVYGLVLVRVPCSQCKDTDQCQDAFGVRYFPGR